MHNCRESCVKPAAKLSIYVLTHGQATPIANFIVHNYHDTIELGVVSEGRTLEACKGPGLTLPMLRLQSYIAQGCKDF